MLSKPRNSALQSSKKALQGSHNRGRVGGGAGEGGKEGKGGSLCSLNQLNQSSLAFASLIY